MAKNFNNLQIAELLRDVAAAYKLKDEGKNRFKIIAYDRAADAVEHASSELKDLWEENELDDVPGIGSSISKHLSELFEKGRSRHFDEVMSGLPPSMFELMKIPGIGAKRAFRLVNEFKLKSLDDLERVAKEGKIADLEGFGEESQADILKSIGEFKNKGEKRMLLPYAMQLADEIVAWMKKNSAVERIDSLGSLRRRASTVGDLDFSVATIKPKEVLSHFTDYPSSSRVLEKGDRTASIILPSGVQADLMVETPDAYGALLQHFTGSKHHNVALRTLALKQNLSLSDYGIYEILDGKNKKLKKIKTEEEFYKKLGMDYIPPEIREDRGEIKAALEHKIPKLLQLGEIKADLQIHSNFNIETSHDLGESTMEDLVSKASELGYEYIAFTEHNPSKSKHSEKQIVEILKRKQAKVEQLNDSIKTPKDISVKKVFNSLEVDILPDGKLPVPEEALNTLDFALVSIHSSFDLTKEQMTSRVLSALSHKQVKIFAHPTARKIGFREGVDLDWSKIFDYCKSNQKWIEINADPMRLDLPDVLVKEAVQRGIKLSMGTDSHHKDSMENMKYGVSVARRGWATKSDIVNTYSLLEFERLI